jgi:hypothetical protein
MMNPMKPPTAASENIHFSDSPPRWVLAADLGAFACGFLADFRE